MEGLANLQNLKLHLPRTVFLAWNTESEGKFDLSALKRFVKLKSLDIQIARDHRYQGPLPKEFTFDPKGLLFPNLKSFKWGASYFEYDEFERFKLLGPAIASHYPVEEFALKFKQFRTLYQTVLKAWSQSLASSKTDVNQLHLSSFYEGLTSKGSDFLTKALASPKLRKMEIFCLELIDCKGIKDKFLVKLGQVIGQNMIGLRFLKLRFEFPLNFLRGLSGVLKSMFGEKGITDTGLKKFGETLSERCGNLELLSLEFRNYGKISDRGVERLCEGLRKIKSLKKVWLRFRLCGGVTLMSGKLASERLGEEREVKFALV